MSDASSTPLTDDEAAMLNWFRQFQTSRYIEGDETVESLIAKQMLFVADRNLFLSAAGLKWLNDNSRFFR